MVLLSKSSSQRKVYFIVSQYIVYRLVLFIIDAKDHAINYFERAMAQPYIHPESSFLPIVDYIN
jgi:hypothetical protein